MADVKRPQRKARGVTALGTVVNIEVGVPAYHDYRQGPNNTSDAMRIRRGAAPACPPSCAGNFKGIS